eukprot:6376794-Amphidinium_carterae.1
MRLTARTASLRSRPSKLWTEWWIPFHQWCWLFEWIAMGMGIWRLVCDTLVIFPTQTRPSACSSSAALSMLHITDTAAGGSDMCDYDLTDGVALWCLPQGFTDFAKSPEFLDESGLIGLVQLRG